MAPVKRYSWGFIAMGVIPYVVAGLVVAGAIGGSYFKGRKAGAESREPEIVALKLDAERSRLAAAAAQNAANEAAEKVRIVYRDRIVKVEAEAEVRTELVEVIRREANPNCVLPPAYRELWDGPINAGSGEAQPAERANVAPVALADAAEAAAEAKRRFEANEAKLIALQNYVSQIQEAPKPN
jgi:hypothetical protein